MQLHPTCIPRYVLRRSQGDDNVRSVMLNHEPATEILSYISKFEYASRRHVALALAFHTMMCVGAQRALDVEDTVEKRKLSELYTGRIQALRSRTRRRANGMWLWPGKSARCWRIV